MSDDREREHCELVATSVYEAFGDDLACPARAEVAGLYRRYRDELGSFTAAHEKSRVEWVADLIQRERAAAAAEARDKALEDAAHLVESEFNTGLLTIPPLKRMAKMIRALRGGGR